MKKKNHMRIGLIIGIIGTILIVSIISYLFFTYFNNYKNKERIVTLEEVMNHGITDESDFKYYRDGDSEIILSDYIGDDDIVVIPDAINNIPVGMISEFAFGNDSKVAGIKISNSVKIIDQNSFINNKNLQVVVFGKGASNIGFSSFQDDSNLHTVILNDSINSISDNAFAGCVSLESIEIPNTVTEIGDYTFYKNSENFTIIGKENSIANEYAMNHNIKFKTKDN